MGCLPPEYRQHQTKHLKRRVQSINELSHVVLRQLGDVRRDPPVVIALVALQIPKLGHRLSSWRGTASFDVPAKKSTPTNSSSIITSNSIWSSQSRPRSLAKCVSFVASVTSIPAESATNLRILSASEQHCGVTRASILFPSGNHAQKRITDSSEAV